jgi:hypothetical protein
MEKHSRAATIACVVLSVVAAAGIVLGIVYHRPILSVLLLLPAVAYEVYRTAGVSTKAASIGMLIILVAEAVLILRNVNLNLATLVGSTHQNIGGFRVPLGDVKTVGPVIVGILSVVLMKRTAGRFTIWLAIVILVGCLALLYALNPEILGGLAKSGIVEQGLRRAR